MDLESVNNAVRINLIRGVSIMKRYDLTPSITRVIDLDDSLLFVNTEEIKPSSGSGSVKQ